MLEIGSISTGTLRLQDLIPSLHGALATQDQATADGLWAEIPPRARLNPNHAWWRSDDASWLCERLIDALQEHAPPGAYVGSHEGDGADIGVWLWELEE
jgi:hypothetical protein